MEIVTYNHANKLNIECVIKDVGSACSSAISDTPGSLTWNSNNQFVPVNRGISILIVDMVYRDDSFVHIRNEKKGTYALYFFYSSQFIDIVLGKQLSLSTSMGYHFLLIEDQDPIEYFVEKGTLVHSVCIFIKKDLVIKYLDDIQSQCKRTNSIVYSKKKVIMYRKNLSRECVKLLNAFEKKSLKNPLYEVYLKGLVYNLIYQFLSKIPNSTRFYSNI